MAFTSLIYPMFLAACLAVYWLLPRERHDWQNAVLLLGGILFYSYWDWRFLALVLGGALTDYFIAVRMESAASDRTKKILLCLSLCFNLGTLAYFKYADFFLDSLAGIVRTPQFSLTARIVLPLGISFFTFQRLGYTLDVYRGQQKGEKNPATFLTFSCFFPILLSGPIERAGSLLQQLRAPRFLDAALVQDGLRQILWGYLKKLVVADRLAPVVQHAFENPDLSSGSELAVAAAIFTVQLYADFSGYSDIALGSAKLFGLRLLRNFSYPLFSRDMAELWRRWHISLSTWFRDYLFFPLGGGYRGKIRWVVNTIITFGLCGLWHGANWKYLIWGLIIGIYFIPLIYAGQTEKRSRIVASKTFLPSLREIRQMVVTFGLFTFSLVFFRADNLTAGVEFLRRIVVNPWFVHDGYVAELGILIVFLMVEWLQRKREFPADVAAFPVSLRWSVYIAMLALLLIAGNFGSQQFIYVQF